MTKAYRYGGWVVYDPGYANPPLGRVAADAGDACFVCYHQGCTAERTPKENLRRATDEERVAAPYGIGFHRFDRKCPEYDAECCQGCIHAGKEAAE